MSKIGRRWLCLLCCAVLLFCLPAGQAEQEAAGPEIRVLLRRLGLTDRVDLTLDALYLAKGSNGAEILFPRAARVTVQLREGELVMFYASMAASMGQSLKLLRQEDGSGETAGLRIGQQRNAYPGSLTLTVQNGQLRPVLTLPLEVYLLGVLPYEMNEYFPAEALKAQAVCARTYALSRRNRTRDYDVEDTTNDQVFQGVSASNVLCAAAVRDTAGVVLTWKDKLAQGYYSASNGGQTELPSHVWGGKNADGGYAIQDDPYDLENPDSLVRTASVRKDGTGLYERFLTLLRNAVRESRAWRSGDYDPDEPDFRVESIDGMTATAPKYSEPSRLMTKLEVTLTFSGKPAAAGNTAGAGAKPGSGPEETAAPAEGEPAPADAAETARRQGTCTVTLNLFPDVLGALGLGISGSGNEMVTVEDSGTAFTLKARRFGHGVGLSQRGAQWMAGHYGMKYPEILAFYYPGEKLKRYSAGMPALPTPAARLAQTPGPAATPTPRPTLMPVTGENLPEGAYLASVEKIDDDSSLNLRAEPSGAAEILMRLYKHQRLVVLSENEVPGWAHVKTDTAEGYVMISFLERLK